MTHPLNTPQIITLNGSTHPDEIPADEIVTPDEPDTDGPVQTVPADVTRDEFDALAWHVWDTHRIITELSEHVAPALAAIGSGKVSLASLLFGRKPGPGDER